MLNQQDSETGFGQGEAGPANHGAFSRPLYTYDLSDGDPSRWHRPTWLYRYYNSYDVLLYVGISFDVFTRDYAHRCATAWRHAATRMTAELFPSQCLAEMAEDAAIMDEDPMANRRRRIPCDVVPVRDQWFIDQQGGIVGCRKTHFTIKRGLLVLDDRAVKVARTI